MKTGWISAVVLLLLGVGVGADVTEEQALEAARRAIGSDLELIRTRETGKYDPQYDLCVQSKDARLLVSVDKRTGRLESYARQRPLWPGKQEGKPPPTVMSPDEAEEVAVAEARRLMGNDYDRLGERVRTMDTEYNTVKVEWPALRVGDPPRWGVMPGCDVTVSLVDGRIVSFHSFVPECGEPIAPKVSADEALAAARRHLGNEHAKKFGEPWLSQNEHGPGTLDWYVKLSTGCPPGTPVPGPDGRTEIVYTSGAGLHLICVNALTGEIVEDQTYGGVPATWQDADGELSGGETPWAGDSAGVTRGEEGPKGRDRVVARGTWQTPLLALAATAVAVACAGATYIVLRRRR